MKLSCHDGLLARQSTSKLCSVLATLRQCQGVYANHYMATTTDNQHKSHIKAHFCQGVSPTPGRKKDWAQLTLCPTTGIAIIGITLPVLPQLREPRLQELQQPEQLLHSS